MIRDSVAGVPACRRTRPRPIPDAQVLGRSAGGGRAIASSCGSQWTFATPKETLLGRAGRAKRVAPGPARFSARDGRLRPGWRYRAMYDLVVLGGGSGGLNVATAAARVGARVALVEKASLGGECTHSACVPSKALVEAARLAHQIRRAPAFGLRVDEPEVDFAAVMARVRAVVAEFAGSDSGDSLRARGIDVFRGSPAFEAYDTVVIDGRTRLNAQRFVIATGSRPDVPAIPGLAEAGYLDNESIWGLEALPGELIVLGAGPSGLEFAQAMARLGSKVTVLSDSDRILPREDPEVSGRVEGLLAAEGIVFRTNVEV